MKLPGSKGPNVHMIGAISSFGPEFIQLKRGAYRHEDCNDWLQNLIDIVTARGVPVEEIVVIMDNAPAHSRMEEVAEDRGFTILRLGPYSPMLNPIENIWSVVKAHVKRFNRTPVVTGPGVIEQRLQYLENILTGSINEITPYLCSQAILHTHNFYGAVLNLENVNVGV